jgi:RNA polymerase sigma factor for flagellar operon FliA
MNPEVTYLEHLRTIERIAAFVARRYRLEASQAEEFVQEVRVRLLYDDYAIIRKFEGRSSFSTYLTTVIGRLFAQWRVEQWGKWRPSAEAKRLGEKAVTLERLLTRDGYTMDEAVRVLTTPAGTQYTVSELEAIYLRLPSRNPRPQLVSDESLPDVVSADADGYQRMEAGDRARTARHACQTVDEIIERLDEEDRLILQLRFWDARRVPDIARTLHLDQKKLYKRLDRLFATLKRELEEAGVSQADVASLLVEGDQEVRLDLVHAGGIPPDGPSHGGGGKNVGGGEGRIR